MGEKRLIHACAKAAMLTNRDGRLEKTFGVRLPSYRQLTEPLDTPSIRLPFYIDACLNCFPPTYP
jgi:hypothetical protein